MPQPSVGISSSIAVFLLLTSVCCILSLSSVGDIGTKNTTSYARASSRGKMFTVPGYVQNFTMTSIIFTGVVALVIVIFKRDDLTTTVNEGQLTRRHYLHGKHSLRSIIFFFVPTGVLHLNYLIVESCCAYLWTRCDYYTGIHNVSQLIFHSGCIVFAICETIVCWIMKPRHFKRSQWVWHGLAVVQAANIAIWFDSLLKEAYHRINESSESFDSYFRICDTAQNRNQTETWCSESSIAAKWFIWSIPFLFPITIEFALLVSESFLSRVIGGNNDRDVEPEVRRRANPDGDNEGAPLLQPEGENQNRVNLPPEYRNSRCSKIFILISLIVNIIYLVLTLHVFVGYKLNGRPGIENQLQTFDNVFTVYSVGYDIFSIICCAVGIISCRKFRRPHSHTSFLEYLLLLATSGVCLQSMKRIVGFAADSDASMFGFYVTCGCLDIVQSLLQIVFYYFAKDVKLQPFNDNGERADNARWVTIFNASLVVISVSNLFIWMSDSFLLPEILPGITPSDYVIEQWPVFDNTVTPITIFFRFNSALLFWCIGTDVFRPGELHQE